ncbi:hypothetical protein [Fluviicola taffensis]|uniref:hypothetical protein n=1 Tax=Fluviicola taffensis TaxID=191579 RepID=UPI00313839E0
MLEIRIKEFLSSLEEREASLREAREIIDFGLDIMNEIKGKGEHLIFRKNLGKSMEPFSYLISEENDFIDLGYWNDNINELKFDLKRFLRALENQKT